MKTDTPPKAQGQTTALRCDALVRRLLPDVTEACITLSECINECEGYDDPATANKLQAVRDVLLSHLPNVQAEPRRL